MYVNESYGGARLKVSIDGKWYNLDVYLMDPSTKDSSGHSDRVTNIGYLLSLGASTLPAATQNYPFINS